MEIAQVLGKDSFQPETCRAGLPGLSVQEKDFTTHRDGRLESVALESLGPSPRTAISQKG